MKTETQEQIDKLQAEFDKTQAEFDRLKSIVNKPAGFEVGKWYRCNGVIACYKQRYNNFGICNKQWGDNVSMTHVNLWTPATNEEVLTALKDYWENVLGAKRGCKFKSASSYYESVYFGECCLTDKHFHNGMTILDIETGKWAEVIKEDKIYIGDNEVCFVNNREYVLLNSLLMSLFDIKNLLPSNPELFGKILKRMEG